MSLFGGKGEAGKSQVTQRQISTGRDNAVNHGGEQLVGNGDLTVFREGSKQIVVQSGPVSPLVVLMDRLAEEIRKDERVQNFVATLQLYLEHFSHDGIDGLENKLIHAGRKGQVVKALQKKELFARLLDEYSMFDSAQNIFAYVLSRMEADFEAYVLPNLGQMGTVDIDRIIYERLILPPAHDAPVGVFTLNPALTAGMVYWLAEKCYIRWHP
ncbi:ABC-three component system protein [Roseomonas gilardii]|uniref:ABC-three component system protein n=1 Tax=Roseomonas gilardii TaxID=257708 RepID=UPI0011A268E9|nr:ABC-three component system protein [Roseomonas gilardii]